jgi:hypothetical protein
MFEITGVRPGTVPPPTAKAPEVVAQPQTTPRATTPRTGQVSAVTTPATTPAPAPVVSAAAVTRAQKLSALLEAYKADRITPIEYHTQRAKILAETQP